MAKATHCSRNHEYTEENTYIAASGSRHCKLCRKFRMQARREGTQVGYANSRKTECAKGHPYDEENTLRYLNSKGTPRRGCKACNAANASIQRIKKYGITVEHYDKLLAEQDEACAICSVGFDRAPHIDHDHATNKVRALLCFNCNAGIGQFGDNIETMKKAIAYLESFSETALK
jgi:hypothetical protein